MGCIAAAITGRKQAQRRVRKQRLAEELYLGYNAVTLTREGRLAQLVRAHLSHR